jgi:serine/threonine protein kinase
VIIGDVAALAREAASASLITHPNIVTVYDADLHGQRPCIVMEFVEGVTLRKWIERQWGVAMVVPFSRG